MAWRHFEAVSCRPDGSFSLASSTLTGNTWDGALWFFDSWGHYQHVPNINMYAVNTSDGISDIKWYNDSKLIVASDTGELGIWTLVAPGNELELMNSLSPGHDEVVLCITVTCDGEGGRHVLSGGGDGRVIVWDLDAIRQVESFKGHVGWLTSLDSHPTRSSSFVSVGMDLCMKLWDLRKPSFVTTVIASPDSSHGNFQSVSWSSLEDNFIATGSETGFTSLYDIRNTSTPVMRTRPHSRSVYRVSLSPLMKGVLASGSEDCTVQIQDINQQKLLLIDESHSDFVHGLSWQQTSDSLSLLSCGWDGKVFSHSFKFDDREDTVLKTVEVSMEDGTEEKENKQACFSCSDEITKMEVNEFKQSLNGLTRDVLLDQSACN